MYGSSSRPFTVGEMPDRLRRAAGDRCGFAIDQGARELQLTGLDDWDDLYIEQLEEKMTHIRMGEQESAMDYCNRAQRILVEMRMAGAEYSMASYITHIVKGLPRGYNLMKRMMMVPGTGESLNEDSITSYILQDEVMQEAEQPTEPFRQASYAAPTKQNRHQEQRGKPGGGGSGAVQANLMEVLLDSGCSHHLMGTKAVFVDMAPSDGVKHVPGFNGALQPVGGRGTVVLQGEARKWVLIPDVLYVPGVHAKVLSAIQLKESGVQLKGDGDVMLLVVAIEEVVALRTIVSATKSTPDWLHARLAHIGVDRIKSSAKHEVANGLDITPSTGVDTPCVSCVRGKLVRHTFPDKGSDAEKALAVVHIDLCGPFWVAAKDGSLYFLLLKDRHTRFVWVMPVAKKSNVLREFKKWLVLVERQAKKSVMMLCSDWGGEFLGKEFTDFIDSKGIVHDLTCPYTPQ
ncbi:unnamed protein product [Closterium sp. NIES-54]